MSDVIKRALRRLAACSTNCRRTLCKPTVTAFARGRRRPTRAQMRCDECGAAATGRAAGWVGVRVDVAVEPDPPEVAIFCPVCVEREFAGCLPRERPLAR
jgi:hypothetical protein